MIKLSMETNEMQNRKIEEGTKVNKASLFLLKRSMLKQAYGEEERRGTKDPRSTKIKKQEEHHFQPYRNLKDYKEILKTALCQ